MIISKKLLCLTILILLAALPLFGCAGENADTSALPIADEYRDYTIAVTYDGATTDYTLSELAALPDAGFDHIYSAINNWPTAKFYAARGIKISAILQAAGALDTAQTVTFRSTDGYEITLTRGQLLDTPQYYYTQPNEDDSGAEQVEAILAYAYEEGGENLTDTEDSAPCLIIGQHNFAEHNTIAFVEGISEIIISTAPAEQWEPAYTFPAAGVISAGESVKLQHNEFGLVKLFYTTDGSDPTELSAMYNPSTYQPELNAPITVTENVTIKVLAVGYGKENSEIASFEFKVE